MTQEFKAKKRMKRFRGVVKLILLGLICLILVAGCQKKAEETVQVPQVTLFVDGQERRFQTSVDSVGELLARAGVELSDLDRLEPAEFTAITDGMIITVVRVQHEVITVDQVIPFEEQFVNDTSVPPDESRILEAGQNGLEQLVYRVVFEDGVEVERTQIRRITVQEARPRVVLVGVRDTFTPVPITGTVAYLTGNKEVGYNAWVMRGSSGLQRRLTSDGTLDTRVFALSPDGRQLLFTRRTSETLANSQLNRLWLLDTTRLSPEPVDLGQPDVLWAQWAPDGESIAYSTGEVAVGAPGWRAHNDLWTAELNSRLRLVRRRQVADPAAGGVYGWWGTRYVWSPSGRYIAYAQADSVGHIRVRDGRRTELRRFPPFRTYSQWVWVPELSWSPDNRFLTSVIHGPSSTGEAPEDSPVFDVWIFDIERPLAVKQANEAGMWAAPAWSPAQAGEAGEPRSSQIAFSRARSPYESANSPYDLYVMDRDGSNWRRIYPAQGDLGLKEPQVAWGPTGRQLITVHENDLFLIDLPRDLVRPLTIDASAQFVVWAPSR
jgi:Tol biopolymer transport system component